MIIRLANLSDGSCSECHKIARYYINLNGLSFRLCAGCLNGLVKNAHRLPDLCHECGQPKPARKTFSKG